MNVLKIRFFLALALMAGIASTSLVVEPNSVALAETCPEPELTQSASSEGLEAGSGRWDALLPGMFK